MRAYCPRFLAKAVETPIITKIEMVTDGSTVYIHVNPIFQKPRQRTTTLATREIKCGQTLYFPCTEHQQKKVNGKEITLIEII
jgi:hypothetical protein